MKLEQLLTNSAYKMVAVYNVFVGIFCGAKNKFGDGEILQPPCAHVPAVSVPIHRRQMLTRVGTHIAYRHPQSTHIHPSIQFSVNECQQSRHIYSSQICEIREGCVLRFELKICTVLDDATSV